jgi:hypothetical protein
MQIAQVRWVAAATVGVKTSFQYGLRSARLTLTSSAAMLLPFLAAADSQLQTGLAGTSMRATAHVNFKIVIPTVLSLDMPDAPRSVREAQTVAIFSNNHNVALAASLRSSEEARRTVVLSSAARKVIEQKVACTPGSTRTAAPPAIAGGVVCTACMP